MIAFSVNGEPREVTVAPEVPLLWVLRDHLGLTGTKYGCGIAQCGACIVHLDGQPVYACVTPVGSVAGRQVVSIEGLGAGRIGAALQQAWIAEQVPQCGYCQSGQLMAAAALLTNHPQPTDEQVVAALDRVLCRCGTYNRVRRAVHRVARPPTKQA
ncbi:MAG: (2Fe-2S)-binding protein [Chromatiaceae bacterium]|nr:MAG: (2Fe-2S)-binding protein [Chromatiaceae bacterium]